METRRFQQIKGGTFTLSLLKELVEKRRPKRGEETTVSEEEDASLRLYPIRMGREARA